MMTSTDVLSIYEKLAGLTGRMADAARSDDWESFGRLENQCALQAECLGHESVPALSGDSRMRKVDLLKAILANDRAIREVTDPWQAQLAGIMQTSRVASTAR